MDLARQRMYSMEVFTVWILMTILVHKMFDRRTKFRLVKKTFLPPHNAFNTGVKEKHFTNWCKEITQGLMGFCGKTAGCSNSRRICHCLNRFQKGCRKKWFKVWKKEVIDPLKLQSGKSFPAKRLQVLMVTEAREKGTRSLHFNLVFLLQIRGHFMYKIHVAVHNSSIWIVRAREAPNNFHCVEFKMEIDQVLIYKCLIKNSRDKIDKNDVFRD